MKVKVKDKVYDGEEEPVMVIFSDSDKENIKNMSPTATKYCSYPEFISFKEISKWMKDSGDKENNFRIMKTHNFDDAKFYRAACSCTDERCDMTLILEIDEEIEDITLQLHRDLCYADNWNADHWYERLWYRIKGTLRLLFTGRIEVDDYFMFQGKNQIESFLNALKEGMDELEEKKK